MIPKTLSALAAVIIYGLFIVACQHLIHHGAVDGQLIAHERFRVCRVLADCPPNFYCSLVRYQRQPVSSDKSSNLRNDGNKEKEKREVDKKLEKPGQRKNRVQKKSRKERRRERPLGICLLAKDQFELCEMDEECRANASCVLMTNQQTHRLDCRCFVREESEKLISPVARCDGDLNAKAVSENQEGTSRAEATPEGEEPLFTLSLSSTIKDQYKKTLPMVVTREKLAKLVKHMPKIICPSPADQWDADLLACLPALPKKHEERHFGIQFTNIHH